MEDLSYRSAADFPDPAYVATDADEDCDVVQTTIIRRSVYTGQES